MKEDITIVHISGDDPALYPLVGPLVMNAAVLKANNNYPFKTSPRFMWYIAQDPEGQVLGFAPLELRKNYWLLNNYYATDEKVLKRLIKALPKNRPIEAVVLMRDHTTFAQACYTDKIEMKKYVKMLHECTPKKER